MTQHSPKYSLRAQDILRYLTAKRLEEKWRKKTRYDLKRQVFPDPVEYLDFQSSIDAVIARIRSAIRRGNFGVSQPRRYHVEKTLGLCRLQTSVEAAIILQCLSDKLYSDIKKQSPSKNAFFEPQDHSFKPTDEQEYGTFKSWKKFQEKILNFRDENKFVVVTDISNYYDFIDLVQLRNVITSFVTVQESLFDFYLHIISALAWRPDFMPPRQIGLPQIDLDAPRLLAHCYLFELDRFMEQRSQKNYARFMDDIDAGVDTIEDAKKLLRDTDLVLQSRSLRLNAGKTRILTAKEAYSHFRVRDNRFLEQLEARLLAMTSAGESIEAKIKKVSQVFEGLYKRGYFKVGNGEKIIKRLIGIYNRFSARIPDILFEYFMSLHPNLRDSALRNVGICGVRKVDFDRIKAVFERGLVCDDYFRLILAKRLVEAKVEYDGTEGGSLKAILTYFPKDDFCSVYAAIWILSRFGLAKTIFKFLEETEFVWTNDESLSRLVAGMWPRLRENKEEFPKYYIYLGERLLPSGVELLEFHKELEGEAVKYKRIKSVIGAKNDSVPLKCTHEKMLVLQSVLRSAEIAEGDKAKLTKTHSYIMSEKSYSAGGVI
ncbi:MAG: RNA-directed DNA polymerase [Mesorhizobium sp.]|uniref:RNA-directed DNA polymerase n=1 Tax=Mesorhizobium sp. TaxID=1871066 RepID=UPI000FEA25DF|nr:RNA-directed DNA polymerase [Mesorhizobium sp.]RWF35704.1 MAG: RNA-directed DNA polymerase [Mesorhizobium sp.]TIX40673.1 MAG: RNA-directed DNA polymerase [Mesorhizobium sp.]